MALLDKYKRLLDTAKDSDIEDLSYYEQDEQLYVVGTTSHADIKNKLWDVYNQIDPNYIAGEVVLNIAIADSVRGTQARIVSQDPLLNLRKGPGTNLPILAEVGKDELLMLISRANDQWWLVRNKEGVEGYCYAQYVEPVGT
ncbi:SH3 domain-containing protein [Sphingobacterium deserti]|uniref:SH3 type 3 domain protein n=1 Tax=Sphingobacterium deserti TaxID=1229276 RepID=A0A0B8T3V1_9SPHI|nr:SH3 domain-containing protein [Sphingobacterium deserti]KGE15921.1 SH3 type 3 domain protein [Sphingobacterium deserti]